MERGYIKMAEKQMLNGMWSMQEYNSYEKNRSYPVQIPGSVLSALLDADVLEDPFYQMNEYQTTELFWKNYMFQREFEVSKECLQQEHIELVCEGLDTLAWVGLNGMVPDLDRGIGTLVAETNNMHRIWRIPVKKYLKEGKNSIQILFFSSLQYMKDYQYSENREIQYKPVGILEGQQLIRKAHSMFGWDWGPQLLDAGIFRDIYLESWSGCRIAETEIRQEHKKNGNVILRVKAILTEECSNTQNVCVSVKEYKETQRKMENGVSEKRGKEQSFFEICLKKGQKEENGIAYEGILEVTDPKLWWPNGYGKQSLYDVEIQVKNEDDSLHDTQKKTIGLRTLTVSKEKDMWGSEFAFTVNGVKIFAMGANYIPEDCVYSRITPKRQEYLLESARKAHFNCIRVWGGGYYPSDTFYDLCDKKGLIVWQDLMFACNVYEVTEEFAKNCQKEAEDNIKRIRHHASLGLLCGNNEIETAWCDWDDFKKETPYLRADYIKLFEYILPKTAKKYAPDTFYWSSSPSSGGCFDDPNSENHGDVHYWEVWHGQKPFTDYENYYFRFCSEFGFQSFPGIKTIQTFTQEEDRNIFSKTMESHQKNKSANGKILYYLSENFRYPSSFENLLYCSQILQGMAMKYGVDHWRRNRERCMGALYWQLNDNWPVASWSSIDYFGRWKALHYMAARFFQPVAASMTIKDEKVTLYIENEIAKEQLYHAYIEIKNMHCETLYQVSVKGYMAAMLSEPVLELNLCDLEEYREMKELPLQLGSWDETVFVEGTLILGDGSVRKSVETLLPYKHLQLPKPKIRTEVTETEDAFCIHLKSDSFVAFVELDFEDADVWFSDNYFHITSEEQTDIMVKKSEIWNGSFKDAKDMENRLKVRSLADTY